MRKQRKNKGFLCIFDVKMFEKSIFVEQILSPEDRIGLIDDAFSLSYAGQLDTTIALRLCAYLVHETEYAPWRAAISWIRRLDDLLSLTPSYKQYKVRNM